MALQIKKAVFVTSAVDYNQAKINRNLPEIAMVGRSNVGKSTLINTLCNNKKLARVSSTPGKTRLINFFNINDQFYLVDLPGYGYAKVGDEERMKWGRMMEGYFQSSENLKHIFLLQDIRRDPSQDDMQMSLWIQHAATPCTIIATKGDKIAKSKRKPIANKLSDKLAMTFKTPTIVFSALERTGKDELLRKLGEIIG